MTQNNAATPLPESDSGANPNSNPNLSVVPPPKPKFTRSDLNRRDRASLSLALELHAAAVSAEFSLLLTEKGIDPPFLAAFLTDINLAGATSDSAVECTNARKAATAAEETKEKKLVASLRELQQAARVEFLPEQPDRLADYHVNQRLDQSRSQLEAYSRHIIDQSDEERPAGVNTDMITRVDGERADFVGEESVQSTELGKGKQDRASVKVLLKSIIARRKKIQRAADLIWAPGKATSELARTKFKLPKSRRYTY